MDGDVKGHHIIVLVVVFQIESKFNLILTEAHRDQFLGFEIENAVYLVDTSL